MYDSQVSLTDDQVALKSIQIDKSGEFLCLMCVVDPSCRWLEILVPLSFPFPIHPIPRDFKSLHHLLSFFSPNICSLAYKNRDVVLKLEKWTRAGGVPACVLLYAAEDSYVRTAACIRISRGPHILLANTLLQE